MKALSRKELTLLVLVIEVPILVLSIAFGQAFGLDIISKIIITQELTSTGIAATALLIVLNYFVVFVLGNYIGIFKPLKTAYDEVCELVSNAKAPEIILIAIFSGMAEEFFFRGLIQHFMGIHFASILFGLFHIGSKKTVSYALYTTIVGYYLGFLYLYTGSLWVPILVHVFNNAIAIPFMKINYRQTQKSKD